MKKEYRVTQVEGKITWKVEELWEGGVTRGPYGSRDIAIHNEEKIAKANGFFNEAFVTSRSIVRHSL